MTKTEDALYFVCVCVSMLKGAESDRSDWTNNERIKMGNCLVTKYTDTKRPCEYLNRQHSLSFLSISRFGRSAKSDMGFQVW